jgi:N,N'-diacetylchitobiose transport system permease protein
VNGPRQRRHRKYSPWLEGAAGLFCLVMIFPVYWMFSTSFKLPGNIQTLVPQFVPWPITLDNFARAIGKGMFWTYARNSIIVSVATVALSIVVAFAAATAVVRFRFFGRRLFLMTVIVVQMIPGAALVIPIYLMLRSVGALDNLPGLIVTYLAFVLPFTIWILQGFIEGVPMELEEAAMVDGCSRMAAFRWILLPLLMPGLVATSIFAFIQAWNDYLFAYVLMMSQSNYTLPVWLVSFSTADGVDYGGLIAASSLFSLPVLVFFVIIQRRLIAGMSAGAVKG